MNVAASAIPAAPGSGSADGPADSPAGIRLSLDTVLIGRLLAPGDFARVLRTKRIGASRHFELFGAASSERSARLGLAISKKAAPTAVLRNLAKRIARESGRAAAARGLPVRDYVVRSRSLLGADWAAAKLARSTGDFRRGVRAELDELFGRCANGIAATRSE